MTRAGYALAVLFAINLLNFFDRQILGAVGEGHGWCGPFTFADDRSGFSGAAIRFA